MADSSVNEKHQAHELIEQLAPSQDSAVVGMLEAMLDPVSRAIANASIDDEPETEQERQGLAESEWFERRGGQGIPHEEVLADFGLTSDDLTKQKDQALRRIAWSERARANIRHLDRGTAIRIFVALQRFAETGEA